MTRSAHQLPAFKCAPLSLRGRASHAPSAHLTPSLDPPITLSLTVFGDDPDEAVAPDRLRGTSFLRGVDQWLARQDDCLGVAVGWDDERGEVDWQTEQDEQGNARLVTTLSAESALNATPPSQQLTALDLVLRFNQKLIADDDTNAALEISPPAKLPRAVRKPLDGVLDELSSKLAAAYPRCFNPRWNQRLECDAKLYGPLADSLERSILGSSDPATRIKLDQIKALLSRQYGSEPDGELQPSQAESGSSGANAGQASLSALLIPALAALARQLVHPPDKLVILSRRSKKKAGKTSSGSSPLPSDQREQDEQDADDEVDSLEEVDDDEDEGGGVATIAADDEYSSGCAESDDGEYVESLDGADSWVEDEPASGEERSQGNLESVREMEWEDDSSAVEVIKSEEEIDEIEEIDSSDADDGQPGEDEEPIEEIVDDDQEDGDSGADEEADSEGGGGNLVQSFVALEFEDELRAFSNANFDDGTFAGGLS